MATSKIGFMIFLTLFSAIIIAFTTTAVSAQCQGDLQGLIEQCARYVQKSGPQETPSQECCNVVKTVDVPCVCKMIPPQVERIVSMEKAVFVLASCGKPLPHGTKCGGKAQSTLLFL
ncbi:hypothetical protein Sango_0341700 [Sesamum angolense]|uniref:Bifunctional inhibitor/plant lipid transfer protein/seed storage helical domain-containing protein n=1 Tax=Sesamum angolense TaxID=2727404 RepID=A0AAE1X9Z2_9LAMI|nr:hypothetical protein Sango_0341700 [Sesamum angolense]